MREITDNADFQIADNESTCMQYFGINDTYAYFTVNSGPTFLIRALSGEWEICDGERVCERMLRIEMVSPQNSITWESATFPWESANFPWNAENVSFFHEFCADCSVCCDESVDSFDFQYLNDRGQFDVYRFDYFGIDCYCHAFCITRNLVIGEPSSSSSLSSQSSSSLSSSSQSSSSRSSSSMSSISSISSSNSCSRIPQPQPPHFEYKECCSEITEDCDPAVFPYTFPIEFGACAPSSSNMSSASSMSSGSAAINLVFDTFHGRYIYKDGHCYKFICRTFSLVNADNENIRTFRTCEECCDAISNSSISSVSSRSSVSSSISSSSLSSSSVSSVSSLSSSSSNSSSSVSSSNSSSSISSESSIALEAFNPLYDEMGGDPHFTYGGTSYETASFNLDDNTSAAVNELYYFSAVDTSGNTINIKYTCQEFPFVVSGGYSISGLIIEDNQSVSTVYAVDSSNSDVLRNDLLWTSAEFTTLGDNVLDVGVSGLSVPSAAGCNSGNPFTWINMGIKPLSGMHNLSQIGGAWWYMWKKASTLTGVLNNDTAPGLDGIGDFLSGFQGFTSRTDFQASPQLEPYAVSAMNEVILRRNELGALTGVVDFDWDPLMSDNPDCNTSLATCGTPNGDPVILVKIEAANAGGAGLFPINFLGCNYTDGETKEQYTAGWVSPTAAGGEIWSEIDASIDRIDLEDNPNFGQQVLYTNIVLDTNNQLRRGADTGSGIYNGFIGGDISMNVVSTTIAPAVPNDDIGTDHFGEVVFDYNGTGNHIRITISQKPGTGW